MLFERSDHEPDEYDPEEEFYDPDADSITIPQAPRPEGDAPADVAKTFWITVVVINVAVLFIALGPMLIYFHGDLRTGGGLVLGGIALFALAYHRYRSFVARRDEVTNTERVHTESRGETGSDERSDESTTNNQTNSETDQ